MPLGPNCSQLWLLVASMVVIVVVGGCGCDQIEGDLLFQNLCICAAGCHIHWFIKLAC